MGGHGGLNILPQKSWNVYNRENRLRVQRDEEQAAREAADISRRDALELSEKNLAELRAQTPSNSTTHSSATVASERAAFLSGGHINFFADAEAAQKNADHEAEQKRADARAIARIMPDLQLDRSAKEPAPWYSRLPMIAPPTIPPPITLPALGLEANSQAVIPSLSLIEEGQGDMVSLHPKRKQVGGEHKYPLKKKIEEAKESRRGKKDTKEKQLKKAKKAKRAKKEREGSTEREQRDHQHVEIEKKKDKKRRRQPSPSLSTSSTSNSSSGVGGRSARYDVLAAGMPSLQQLRLERLERERREQRRMPTSMSRATSDDSAAMNSSASMLSRCMELTGQALSIKHEQPRWRQNQR
jgi:hypothetical protein